MGNHKNVKVTAKGLEGFLIQTKAGAHTAYVISPQPWVH
jgi:hypothetical protein